MFFITKGDDNMRFKIEHEIRGRVRLHICQKRMTCRQADQLEYFLANLEQVTAAKVVERNQDAVISFSGNREEILKAVQGFSYEKAEAPELSSEFRQRNERGILGKSGQPCAASLWKENFLSSSDTYIPYHA